MGGYGHSRIAEYVFGGVTRYMLANAPVPIVIAH
jgi:nucleotide-binding universal stress UspA family protein